MRSHIIAAGVVSAILAFNPTFSALALASGADAAVPTPAPSPMVSPTTSPTPAPTPVPTAAPSTEPSAAPTPRPAHNNNLTNALIAVAFVIVVINLIRPNDMAVPAQSLQRKPGLWLQFHLR
jgi:hypothetical protein